MPPLGEEFGPAVLDQNQQDYTTQIARALAVQGVVPGKLDPLVGVGIQLEDFRAIEFQFLRRCVAAYFGASVAAGGAGTFGFGSIRGADGMLVILDRVIIGNPTAAAITFSCGIATAFPSGVGSLSGTAMDTRYGVGTANTAAKVRGAVDPAPVGPTIPFAVTVPPGSSFELTIPAVLTGSGAFFSVIAGTANVPISTAWFWRERPMLNTEGL